MPRALRRTLVAALLLLAGVRVARADVPLVEGPITSPGSAFITATAIDLADVGYVQEEFFLSGTASSYVNTAPMGADGRWTVAPADTAAYKTRIVVIRPADASDFHGTVVVEWLNVSGGIEAAPDWVFGHVQLIRAGAAWVGVSVQKAGIDGGGGLLGIADLSLKAVNPARYGSLLHPGDSFSYDIFTQVGTVVRTPAAVAPLGDLRPKIVLAVGESQSAFRMVNYLNAIQPLTHTFDGFLVHSRGDGNLAPLSQAPQADIPTPAGTLIRDDQDVPVLMLQTETDLTFLASFGVRQPDTKHYRLWEVAGTAHADTYTVVRGFGDTGTDPAVVQPLIVAEPLPGIISCAQPINDGPQHFAVKAAFAALERWVKRGKPPKPQPRLDVAAGPPVAIARDDLGNGRGGIRYPQLEAPLAVYGGEQDGSIICRLFGTTTLLDDATLARLYPTKRAFLTKWNRATRRAVKAGVLLKPDAKLLKRWAATADVGG